MPFQKIAMTLAVGMILALGGGSACAQTVSLKLSHFVPPQHAFHKWVVDWTQKLETESGGRLKFQIYPNGQIVGPPNRQFDAARNGIVDIAFCLHGVTPGRYPMTEIANLPYSWPGKTPDIVEMAKRMTELAPKYLAKEHTGLHILFMSMANPVVLYSKTPINSVADFKGKKIRYASITNKQLLEAAGATPMLIPPPEAQDALAKGIAEGATFPHEAGLAYDLASVVKYAIEPPMASATFALVMNPAKYNALPADLRAILDKASGVAGAVSFGTAWKAQEEFARNLETSKKGLEIITLPEAEVAKLKAFGQKITTENLDALEKKGQPARAFYDAYMK
jgi:TRAP-type C4-dicarboxylate transport system substrate-binding protein